MHQNAALCGNGLIPKSVVILVASCQILPLAVAYCKDHERRKMLFSPFFQSRISCDARHCDLQLAYSFRSQEPATKLINSTAVFCGTDWENFLNPFPHNKILDQTKLEALADDKL